ncbi:3-oxoacyl-ACP reductase FabG [Candidatus Babeliales bacterium]|nr:3-oxoacyl-ACP reductase FabG [Candidatus Babeliales bacterium]
MKLQKKLHKNVLITGGLQGIGKAIALTLKKRGDCVFVFDHVAKEDKRVEELKNFGIYYFLVDISDTKSIDHGFFQLFDILKNDSLDILVNNAGITRDSLAIRMDEKNWDDVFDVNLKGAFFCCKFAIKRMMRQSKSYIINISSIVGKTGNVGQINYAASKAGLISITKTLAAEYGKRNILVNAIAPGFIQTDMTKKLDENIKNAILQRISLKRFGEPNEVAYLVEFLTGGKADYITGSVIDLNGGLF